ncbi:MAG: hypothetical protein RIR66_965 [Actinomycetota bacterium]
MQAQLIGSAVLGAITLISSIALMATSGWLISKAALMPPVLTLSVAVVGVRTFALSRGVARYAERLLSHNATFNSLTGIHRAVFDRLEKLAPSGLPAFRRGDLLARLVSDVDAVQDLPLRVVLPITSGVLAASFAVGLSAWLLPSAGLVMLLTLLFAGLVIPLITAWSAAKSERATAEVRGELVDELIEFYSGNADIISLGQHEVAITRLTELDEKLTSISRKQAFASGLASGLLILAQGVAILCSTYVAIVAFTDGKIDGALLAVLTMIPMAAFESVSNFPNAALALARVRSSANRLIEVMDSPDPITEPAQSSAISSVEIKLTNASAAWTNQDAVSDVNFVVPQNSSLGLVGPSGSGKSTIIAILQKFLSLRSGKYTLGDVDSTQLSGQVIREKLIASSPEQHIFATTISENLRLASDHPQDLTDDQMWKALAQVQLADWVKALPSQLETMIGERGSTMSGGQKQRLALARLFIANPNVWLLDEPTEHLDSLLADQVMEKVLAATNGKSLIVASHRLADTSGLDQVYQVSRPHD